MTDKERLEEIKRAYRFAIGISLAPRLISESDIEWIFNRVEELEKEKDNWKDTAQSYYMTNQELREQNKRYKQELEYIKRTIYTQQRAIYIQHCTKNHKWNAEFEKGQINGLIQASNIVDKAIRKVEVTEDDRTVGRN